MWHIEVPPCRLEVVESDITRLRDIEVLVSSDDNYLSHGGGVSRAIWQAAGEDLAPSRPRLSLGSVHASGAGKLGARYILHAITVDFDLNRAVTARELRTLVGHLLLRADDLHAASVALPVLASGAGQLPVRAAAVAIATAVEEHAVLLRHLRRIVVCAFADAASVVQAFSETIQAFPRIPELLTMLEPHSAFAREAWESIFSSPATSAFGALRFLEACVRLLAALPSGDESSGGEEPRHARSSLGQLVRDVADRRRRAGRPLERELHGELLHAVQLRNQIAHGPLHLEAGANAMILATSRLVLARSVAELQGERVTWSEDASVWTHFVAAAPSKALPRSNGSGSSTSGPGPAPPPRAPKQARRRSPPNDTERAASGRAEVDSVATRGTQAVRALRDFLWQQLSQEALGDLARELRAQGYRAADGDEDLLLLECCVEAEDLVELVTSHFTKNSLLKALSSRGLSAPAMETHGRLAERLLEHFGFPIMQRLEGLESVTTKLTQLRAEVPTASPLALKGLVSDGAANLEYAIQVVIRFVCRVVWQDSPEIFLRDHGLGQGRVLAKASLGTLLSALDAISKRLAEESSPRVMEFRRDFQVNRLAPEGTGSIANLRNTFAHHNEEAQSRSIVEQRRHALAFFDAALALLAHFGSHDTRVFPLVVRIEEVRFDRYGRRMVIATSDRGLKEHIFTDHELLPGQQYFMHPLTNPLRVDPILVASGTLWPNRG